MCLRSHRAEMRECAALEPTDCYIGSVQSLSGIGHLERGIKDCFLVSDRALKACSGERDTWKGSSKIDCLCVDEKRERADLEAGNRNKFFDMILDVHLFPEPQRTIFPTATHKRLA